jgi:GTP:adenosylcobinamide-phosphate guanylyltransferase
MSYRVCIPCAGTGSRLGGLTQYINKSLVSIANRPTLSHLIEQFPADVEFVIALGHKGHLIREFLTLAYPERQFFFTEVSPFEGPGSGLGLSLQTCKQHLQQPFVFISCDTLVEEPIPAPDSNWMGYAEVPNLQAYRTIALTPTGVSAIAEKGVGYAPEHKAYIGLAGIYDYQQFWAAMEQGGDTAIAIGEAHGMRSLLPNTIQAHAFTWHDAGNLEALAQTRQCYREPDEPNILEKANEAIWFVGNAVIKFSDDKKFIANRVKRVKQLQGFVPDVTGAEEHMYRYPKVQGKVLSEVITLPLFDRLLDHCTHFWEKKTLTVSETVAFQEDCMKFYRDKTFERVELFYRNFNHNDGSESINGRPMPKLEALLHLIDWHWLANGVPGRFHGDFHFENILWNKSNEKFVFLDWRQDFAGDLNCGDIYYDFAKLLHGLIISHELIASGFYSVDWQPETIEYDFHRKQILVDCERHLGAWLESRGYDRKKVWTLTALIYLNIAALHHDPYCKLLYGLGKNMLYRQEDGKAFNEG